MNWLCLRNNQPVEVQDFRRVTNHFRGMYGPYLNLIQKNWRMSSACNRLDLQTPGSQLIMPKNLPHHCPGVCSCAFITPPCCDHFACANEHPINVGPLPACLPAYHPYQEKTSRTVSCVFFFPCVGETIVGVAPSFMGIGALVDEVVVGAFPSLPYPFLPFQTSICRQFISAFLKSVSREVFRHTPSRSYYSFQVQPVVHVVIFPLFFIDLRYTLHSKNPVEWRVIFLKSQTSTELFRFSNSTGSSVPSARFSLFIVLTCRALFQPPAGNS